YGSTPPTAPAMATAASAAYPPFSSTSMPTWLTIGSTEATAPPPPRITGIFGSSWSAGGLLRSAPSGVAVAPEVAASVRTPTVSALTMTEETRLMTPHARGDPHHLHVERGEGGQRSVVVPSATSAAGPASSTSRPGRRCTRSVPPGTSTVVVEGASTSPDQNRVPIAAAQTPVPQERVSPTPRSWTRIEMRPGPRTRTNSTLLPSGGTGLTAG